MNTYTIEKIENFSSFTQDVYLDKKFILLPNNIPFDEKLKEKLLECSFTNVYSEGIAESASDEDKEKATESEVTEEASEEGDSEYETLDEEQKKEMLKVENVCVAFLAFVSKVYSLYASRQHLDVEDIFEKAKEFCEVVKEHKHKIIAIPKSTLEGLEPDLILHVVETAIYAIIIAVQLKMPQNRIVELTVAAILHKIGFLRIPPYLYTEDRALTDKELKTFRSHPIVAYRILKEAGFPITVCVGVLEHHEREDGSGYPRGLNSENISIFGKILSLACSFEAAKGNRKTGYGMNSILDVVRNTNKQYSDVVLKSLLFSVSIFPIGTFVQLSDKRIGQVLDINPKNLNYPIVLIYGGMSNRGEAQIVNTSSTGVSIRKPLTKAEIDNVKSVVASAGKK
ncbi:MAG: HD-GYP domain-containing protein [Treponema sp.]